MGGDQYMNERELLYKVLFDMKRDINELKQRINGLTGERVNGIADERMNGLVGSVVPYSEHRDLRRDPEELVAEEVREPIAVKDEPLTMGDAEEAMIRKALERHGGNRKEAAAELGISERTLYRKLKSLE